MDDISTLIGEYIEMDEGVDGVAVWFEPQDGIFLLEQLIAALQADPKRLQLSERGIDDLQNYRNVLTIAATYGAKWHLAIDI